jgi:biopolymer transport protein ExbD
MAMSVGPADSGDDEDLNSSINTTPLVDVMLVLLIIFLITVPVVAQSMNVQLPTVTNIPTQTKPENINISVNKDGDVFWGTQKVPDMAALLTKLKLEAVKVPQPEVHIRGDLAARYESVGKVVYQCQRAGISKIGFITNPVLGVE